MANTKASFLKKMNFRLKSMEKISREETVQRYSEKIDERIAAGTSEAFAVTCMGDVDILCMQILEKAGCLSCLCAGAGYHSALHSHRALFFQHPWRALSNWNAVRCFGTVHIALRIHCAIPVGHCYSSEKVLCFSCRTQSHKCRHNRRQKRNISEP